MFHVYSRPVLCILQTGILQVAADGYDSDHVKCSIKERHDVLWTKFSLFNNLEEFSWVFKTWIMYSILWHVIYVYRWPILWETFVCYTWEYVITMITNPLLKDINVQKQLTLYQCCECHCLVNVTWVLTLVHIAK